jgi:hypothetical protein
LACRKLRVESGKLRVRERTGRKEDVEIGKLGDVEMSGETRKRGRPFFF